MQYPKLKQQDYETNLNLREKVFQNLKGIISETTVQRCQRPGEKRIIIMISKRPKGQK